MNKKWFQERLKSVGMTQKALADEMHVRIPAITDILNGNREIYFVEACKIAKILKCSLDELYFAYKGKRIEASAINRLLLSKAIKDSLAAITKTDSTDEDKALIITLRYDDLIKEAMFEQKNISG